MDFGAPEVSFVAAAAPERGKGAEAAPVGDLCECGAHPKVEALDAPALRELSVHLRKLVETAHGSETLQQDACQDLRQAAHEARREVEALTATAQSEGHLAFPGEALDPPHLHTMLRL